MYPCLFIDLEKLKENIQVIIKICEEKQVSVTAVTKGFCADPLIVKTFVEAGITRIGDSRIENLKKLILAPVEKWLIRPPMLCEADEVVRWADVSVNSELSVIRQLAQCAKQRKKQHGIILMADLGDIREGYIDEGELLRAAEEIESLPSVKLIGIGTNLTCFSFVTPDTGKMERLREMAEQVELCIGRKLELVSGGNSATIDLLMREGLPQGVNNLRLGESLLFGRERVRYRYLPGTHPDVFTLKCQIVELKIKPSLPWGTIGVDSYGNKPQFTDRGARRLKAICALGKQDFDVETSWPEDPGIIILGSSSDHLMLDVTDSSREYRVGDTVSLRLGYFSMMRAFTSQYVGREYIGG